MNGLVAGGLDGKGGRDGSPGARGPDTRRAGRPACAYSSAPTIIAMPITPASHAAVRRYFTPSQYSGA